METETDFIFLGSKITVDNDCSHEIKRHLLLRRKAMTKLDGVFKKSETSLCCPYSQSYGFSKNHDRSGPLEKGLANHFSILALRAP